MAAKYTYSEMEKMLAGAGFRIYEHLDAKQMTERYFSNYNAYACGHEMSAPAGTAYVLAVRG